MATEPDHRERYGAGLPRVGERDLAPHETQSIQRGVRTAIVQTVAIAVAASVAVMGALAGATAAAEGLAAELGGPPGIGLFIFGFAGAFGAVVVGRPIWKWPAALGLLYMMMLVGARTLVPDSEALPSPYVSWAVASSTVVVGLGFMTSRAIAHARILLRLRRVRADIEAGRIAAFEGRLRIPSLDRALARLLRRPALPATTGNRHRVEILPTSGLIVRVDGHLLEEFSITHLASVAPPQPHAFRTALPDGLAPAGTGPVSLHRRSLTHDERQELDLHIDRLRRRHWQLHAVLVGVAGSMVWQLSVNSWSGLWSGPCLAWYGLCVFTVVSYVRRLRAAERLECDRDLRWVVTVDDDDRRSDPRPPKLEVLPISQLAWTENASPANWRIERL